MGIAQAKRFLREMAQPYDAHKKLGISLWTSEDIDKFSSQIEKKVALAARELEIEEDVMMKTMEYDEEFDG